MPSIDDIYVEIKLMRDQVKSELAKFQSDVEHQAKGIEGKLNFKARFDGSMAKLRITELQNYRQKLQEVFDKKVAMNVDGASLNRTRQQLASIDSQLTGLKGKLSFEARFDGSMAKLNIKELEAYRNKLQEVFDKKVAMNVDGASLNRTRQQLASVDSQLTGVKSKLSFEARFDGSMAKLRITELQNYRNKLQEVFDKKVAMNVDSASLDRTREQLASVDSQLAGVGKSAVSMGQKIIAGLVAFGAIRGVFTFLKNAISHSINAAVSFAQLSQAIKQTGGAAGYSAGHLRYYIKELSKLTGITQTAINKGFIRLLGYTGLTGKMFKEAGKAAVDMATVLEIDVSSAAERVGNALQYPTLAINSLTKQGFRFSEEQKRQILNFEKTNQLAKAQEIVLGELELVYGGQAKVINDAKLGTVDLSNAWDELGEAIGDALAPFLSTFLPAITKGIKGWIGLMQEAGVEFKRMLSLGEDVKIEGWLSTLKKSTKESRAIRKKEITEEMADNKRLWDERQVLIDKEINSYGIKETAEHYAAQKHLSNLNASLRAEEKALLRLDKLDTTSKRTDAGEEILRQYAEEQFKIQEITNLINEGNLSKGQENRLIEERNNLLKKPTQKTDTDKKYIEDLANSLEEYRKKIKLVNDELNKIGETNLGKKEIELKAIYTADLKKLQEQLKEAEITLGLKVEVENLEVENLESIFPKGYTAAQVVEFEKLGIAAKGYADYSLAVIEERYQKQLAAAKGNAQQILTAEENKVLALEKLQRELDDSGISSLKNRREAIDNYYSSAKTLSEEYFQNQLAQMEDHRAELAKFDPTIAKEYEIERLKELEQEYFDWRLEKWQEQAGLMGDVFISGVNGISAGYDEFWNSLSNADITGAERMEQVWDSIKTVALDTFGQILKEYISTAIQQAVIGDSMKAAELVKGTALGSSLAAAYMPAATLASIMSFGGASLVGAAALTTALATTQALASIPSFKEGGEFYQGKKTKSYNQIPKFATGTEFNVPSKYINDSFLMRVSGDERVKVTPANKVGDAENLLSDIANKIALMNANLVDKNFAPNINADTYLDGRRLTKSVFKTMDKMQKEGRKTL